MIKIVSVIICIVQLLTFNNVLFSSQHLQSVNEKEVITYIGYMCEIDKELDDRLKNEEDINSYLDQVIYTSDYVQKKYRNESAREIFNKESVVFSDIVTLDLLLSRNLYCESMIILVFSNKCLITTFSTNGCQILEDIFDLENIRYKTEDKNQIEYKDKDISIYKLKKYCDNNNFKMDLFGYMDKELIIEEDPNAKIYLRNKTMPFFTWVLPYRIDVQAYYNHISMLSKLSKSIKFILFNNYTIITNSNYWDDVVNDITI